MKIIIYVLILLFLFLLIKNAMRNKEGYLTDLKVGNWDLKGDSDTLNVSSGDGKSVLINGSVVFKTPIMDEGHPSLDITDKDGNQKLSIFGFLNGGSYNPIVQPGDISLIYGRNGDDIDKAALSIAPWSNKAKGLRIDKDGNVHIPGNLIVDGLIYFKGNESSNWRIGADENNSFIVYKDGKGRYLRGDCPNCNWNEWAG